jgi:hypothetical protein
VKALCSSLTNENCWCARAQTLGAQADFTAYRMVFTGTDSVLNAYLVTIVSTLGGTLLTLLLTGMLAYPLSVKSLRYRGAISMFLYFTMLFNGGLVANYILISRVLGMRDSLWVLIIPGALTPQHLPDAQLLPDPPGGDGGIRPARRGHRRADLLSHHPAVRQADFRPIVLYAARATGTVVQGAPLHRRQPAFHPAFPDYEAAIGRDFSPPQGRQGLGRHGAT